MTKVIEEVNVLIAVRVPPGDRWQLVYENGKPVDGTIIEGIVEALSVYMRANNFVGHYRLAPRDGELYAILQEEREIVPEKKEPKKFDLYGEF